LINITVANNNPLLEVINNKHTKLKYIKLQIVRRKVGQLGAIPSQGGKVMIKWKMITIVLWIS
jgi:hypothetical protein